MRGLMLELLQRGELPSCTRTGNVTVTFPRKGPPVVVPAGSKTTVTIDGKSFAVTNFGIRRR